MHFYGVGVVFFSTTAIGVNVKRFAGSNCVRLREAIRVSASARGVSRERGAGSPRLLVDAYAALDAVPAAMRVLTTGCCGTSRFAAV
jgi:hypothetical protein